MPDFIESNKTLQAQIDIFSQLHLINVAEIEILKEVLYVINTKYFDYRKNLDPAFVCALLLNHEQIPRLYATSTKGFNRQRAKYQQQCEQIITDRLLPWAIEEILKRNTPRTLNQDQVIANNLALKKIRAESWRSLKSGQNLKVGETDIFDLLANLNLTNVIETEIILDAHSHIQTDYTSTKEQIDLSDVCALVLNHGKVPALYVTNAKEYNQNKQVYLREYQPKIRKIIRQTVNQVKLEGSESSFSQNMMAKNRANMRNVNSWNNSSR